MCRENYLKMFLNLMTNEMRYVRKQTVKVQSEEKLQTLGSFSCHLGTYLNLK